MHYRADLMFDSSMTQDDFAIWLEDNLYSISNSRAAVTDMNVYEVAYLPGDMNIRNYIHNGDLHNTPEDPT